MTDRELMQQALDALLLAQRQITYASFEANKQMTDAYDALLARLAMPEKSHDKWLALMGALVKNYGESCALFGQRAATKQFCDDKFGNILANLHARTALQPKEPT